MAAQVSAGLLMYNENKDSIEFFLVHPGGPYFAKKDEGYWGIPKGLQENDEDLLDTAIREFQEETGISPHGEYLPLGTIKQKNGKIVYAWAFKTEISGPVQIQSNHCEVEWPPHSGKMMHFPEVDKGNFFNAAEANLKIVEAQKEFITRLEKLLKK